MTHSTTLSRLTLCAALLAMAASAHASELDKTFTYQGRLAVAGQPANGNFNLTYRLFDSAVGGVQMGVVTHIGVPVAGGLFTDQLNFTPSPVNGRALWLEITVNGVTLSPRQALTSAPSALTLAPGAEIRGASASPTLKIVNESNLIGVWGQSDGDAGRGVFGHASSTNTVNYGVYGETASVFGRGVIGVATPSTGPCIGVMGQVFSPTAFAGYFVGGKNYFEGRVGVGNTFPSWPLHVTAPQAVVRLDTETSPNGSVIELRSNLLGKAPFLGAINFVNLSGQTPGQIAYTGDGEMSFRADGFERIRINSFGTVCMGNATHLDTGLFVTRGGPMLASAIAADRAGNGTLMTFTRNGGSPLGSISVFNDTVSYNAFTGSHLAWADADEPIERLALVRMTGENRRAGVGEGAEVIYGVEACSRANDQACLGAYLGAVHEPTGDRCADTHLIMAVGNGEMRIVDSGAGDIRPGDYLISSAVSGCAMKDDPARYPVGYIVARAAEPVDWSAVEIDSASGVKRATISVLFESFVRDSSGGGGEWRTALEEQAREIERLRAQVQSMAALAARLDRLEARDQHAAARPSIEADDAR